MKSLLLTALLYSLICLTSYGTAEEWTRFRGPNGTGVASAPAIPVEFTEADYKFKVELPGGSGCSSPVIWGNSVFLLSANSSDATRYVVCMDASNGKTNWQREFKSEAHNLHTRSSYASCTPAVDEERVYVAWSTPKQTLLKAFNHNGSEAWSIDLGTW